MAAISPAAPEEDPGQTPKPHWLAELLRQLKELPEWLNVAKLLFGGVGGLAATVVATFALQDLPWAYTVAAVTGTVIMLGVVALLTDKAWTARSRHGDRVLERSILIGIGPIEHAPLPRREGDARRLLDMVTGLDYRYGVLMGKSGSGKTSLIRAELLPRLVKAGHVPIYLPSSAGDILATTRLALAELYPTGTPVPEGGPRDLLRGLPAEQRQRMILLYDQFDELLLSADAGRRNRFVEWVRQCVKDSNLKVRFLFVMRSDVYASMQELLPTTPGAWSIAHRHELTELSPEDARGVLKLVVAQHEAKFATRLLDEIASDLSYRDRVSPVLLQIVATALKQRGISSKRGYRAIGEAAAILEWHVVEQIQGAPDPCLAHHVLKQLTGSGEWQPGVGQGLESILTGVGDPAPAPREARKTSICKLLARLASARLVIRTVNGTYGIPHPLLHAAVVSAVAQVEAETAPEVRAAVALLDRYVATSRIKSRVSIPYWDLRTIRRRVPLRSQLEQPAQTLLWKSALLIRLVQVAIVSMLTLAAVLGALVLTHVIVPYDDWDDPIPVGMPEGGADHAPAPKVVGFLPGSKRLVLAHTDTDSRLGELYAVDYKASDVEPVGGRAQATLQRLETDAPLTALAFHPDGSRLASGDENGEVRIWDGSLQGGKVFLEPGRDEFGQPCAEPAVKYLSYSAGGVRLVVSRCQSVEIWNTVGKSLLGRRDLPRDVRADAIRANPSGDFVALVEASGEIDQETPGPLVTTVSQVFVWELDLNQQILRDVYATPPKVTSSGVLEIGFSQEGRLVVATTEQLQLMPRTFDRKDALISKPDMLGVLEEKPFETLMSNDGTVIAVTDGRTTWWVWRDRPWFAWLCGSAMPEVLKPIQWDSGFMSADGKALLLTGSPRHALFKHDFHLVHLSRLWPYGQAAESTVPPVRSARR